MWFALAGEMEYEKVYFPAQTYGVDTNRTFAYAGLIVYTDANVTLIPHDCNETLGCVVTLFMHSPCKKKKENKVLHTRFSGIPRECNR